MRGSLNISGRSRLRLKHPHEHSELSPPSTSFRSQWRSLQTTQNAQKPTMLHLNRETGGCTKLFDWRLIPPMQEQALRPWPRMAQLGAHRWGPSVNDETAYFVLLFSSSMMTWECNTFIKNWNLLVEHRGRFQALYSVLVIARRTINQQPTIHAGSRAVETCIEQREMNAANILKTP